MSDTQMLSKYLPKKLYNAAADQDGTDLTAKEALPEDRLTALETYVGDYSSPPKGEGRDIATDLATVYASVETAGTGLNARTDDLETAVGTYSGAADIATDLSTAEGDIDNLEEAVGTYSGKIDISTDLATVQAVAPTTGAPTTAQVAAAATYDTNKITFTAKDAGADGNNITVEASCRLSATLGSGTTEITLTGEDGLYPDSTPPLVSVQITQAATEAPISITNTKGVITVSLPADENNAPIDTNMGTVFAAIQEQILFSTGVLNGVIADITIGGSYDPNATCVAGAAVPFTAADITVEENDGAVLILLAYDSTNFNDWEYVATEVNGHANSTLVTASDGAQSEAGPFEAMSLTGGVNITAGAPGAIRYEATKIWISVADSTASVSNWKYAALL